jgi:hypothetical protein
VIAAALLAAALGACGAPVAAAGPRPFRTGETLAYDLDLLGMVKAGTLELSVERPMSAGKVIPLRARARTSAQVATLKKLTAVALSWVDAGTLLPERFRDESLEGDLHRSSDVRLRPPGPEVVIAAEAGDRKGESRHARQGDVLDAVSTLYLLRAARLAPGDRFCFDGVGRGRYWRVEATVAAGKERVETPAGRFSTFRVDVVARRADAPAAKPHEVHLWFSDDGRRLLVAAVADLDLGPASVTLTAVRGAKDP